MTQPLERESALSTGGVATAELTDPAYWCRQLREPVQFAAGIETLYQQGCRAFVEIGPHPVLASAIAETATAGPLPRSELAPGLEDWAGEPFLLVTGEPHRAQALWSFAHGMVILEIDGRFPAGSDLDRTWRAGAAAFAPR